VGEDDGPMLRFTNTCVAVVCSRVSPKQKADVVHLVKTKHGRITLAIGDGANDVSMILKAHIGVGISGREGAQAAMSSDYSIAQFRYLTNLVLIHGRWSYQRLSLLICYSFYKNISFSTAVFWFGLNTGYSGILWWEDLYQTVWNVFFTGVPIFFVASFNKDVHYKATLLEFPEMYKDVQYGQPFSKRVFAFWVVDALIVSILVYFIPTYGVEALNPTSSRSDGLDSGLWLCSFTSMAAIHTLINLRLWMETRTWNWVVLLVQFLSLTFFWMWAGLFQLYTPGKFLGFVSILGTYYMMLNNFAVNGICIACFVFTTVLCLIIPWLYYVYMNWPSNKNKSLQVQMFEAQKLEEQIRMDRVPTEEAWAQMLPLLRKGEEAPEQKTDDYPKFNASEDALGVTPSNTPKQRSMSFHTRSGSEAEEYLGYAFSGQRGEDPRLLSDTTSHVRSGTGRTHGSSPNTARSQRSDGPGAALNDAAVLNGVTTPSAPNGASTNLLDASSDYREVRASELLNGNAH